MNTIYCALSFTHLHFFNLFRCNFDFYKCMSQHSTNTRRLFLSLISKTSFWHCHEYWILDIKLLSFYFILFYFVPAGCYTSHIKILYEIQNTFKNKEDYSVIILEDNLEITRRMSETVLKEVASFVKSEKNWDVFHLAYMMWVKMSQIIKW